MFSQIAPLEKLALCWGDSHCPPFLSGKKSHPSHCVVLLPLTERTSSSLSNPCPSTVCRMPAPQKHPFLRSVLRIEVFASTWGEHTCRAAPQSRCVCTSLFSCNVLWLSQNTCHRAPVSGLRVIFHQMGALWEQSCVSFTLFFFPVFHPYSDQEERFEVQPIKRQVNTFTREVFSTVKIAPWLNFKIFFLWRAPTHQCLVSEPTWIKYQVSVHHSAPHPQHIQKQQEMKEKA